MNFEETIKKYEKHRDKKIYARKDKNPYESTIRGDSHRSFVFLPHETNKEKWCKNLFQYICNEIFINSTIDYYQGMTEIGAFIIYHYFNDSLSEQYDKISQELLGSINSDEEEIEDFSGKKNSLVDENLSQYIDEEIYEKCITAISNAIDDKFIPVVDNNFSLYDKYNNVFLRMMRNRNINIDLLLSKKYMNTTLSWFTRSVSHLEDTYKILSLILESPTNVTFLLLVKYYDEIENGRKIEDIPDDLPEELNKLQSEFAITESEIARACNMPSKKILFGLGAAGVIIGIYLYQVFRKDK